MNSECGVISGKSINITTERFKISIYLCNYQHAFHLESKSKLLEAQKSHLNCGVTTFSLRAGEIPSYERWPTRNDKNLLTFFTRRLRQF
jgi:hypothetical protein